MTAPCDRSAEVPDLIGALERELGVKGLTNVFREALRLAKAARDAAAPCDEHAKRENASAVEGRSPAGAVTGGEAEGQAPNVLDVLGDQRLGVRIGPNSAEVIEPIPSTEGQTPKPSEREEIARLLCARFLELGEGEGYNEAWWGHFADVILSSSWNTRRAHNVTKLVERLAAKDETLRRLEGERDEALTEHTDMMWQRRRAEERADAAEARAQTAEAERDEYRSYAHALQVALTWFAGGGSENFVRHGDEFRADIEFCRNKIQDRLTRASNRFREAVRDCKAAEAERDEAVRKLGEAQDALRKAEAQSAEHKATASDLAGALEPFAEVAENLEDEQPDRDNLWESPEAMDLTVGDLRRARAAITRSRKPENKGTDDE